MECDEQQQLQVFWQKIGLYDPHQLVFVDKSSFNWQATYREYAWLHVVSESTTNHSLCVVDGKHFCFCVTTWIRLLNSHMSGEDQSSLSAHMGSYKNKGTNHEMRDIPSVDDDNEHAWGNDLGESYYQGHDYHLANAWGSIKCMLFSTNLSIYWA